MKTKLLVVALATVLLILVVNCGAQPMPPATARPAPMLTPSPPQIRPVEIREVDQFSPSEPGKEHIVTAFGKVVDANTLEEIPSAKVTFKNGPITFNFGSSFNVHFPTMTVITIKATAPGYRPVTRQVKFHYKRDVTVIIDIPMERLTEKSD